MHAGSIRGSHTPYSTNYELFVFDWFIV